MHQQFSKRSPSLMEALHPHNSLQQIESAIAVEIRAAHRTLSVLLGIAMIGTAVPLLMILFPQEASSLTILKCASVVVAAGCLDYLLLQLYKASMRQRRRLILRCERLERDYALAKLALSVGRYRWAATILMKVRSSQSRRNSEPHAEARAKASQRGSQETSAQRRAPTSVSTTAVSPSMATVLNIEAARTRRRLKVT